LFFIEERMQKPLLHRNFKDVKTLLEGSVLTHGSKQGALKTFKLLAEAESSAHGVSVETVHFHEVGALDSIVDIVAVAVCLDYLGVNEVIVSPLPIGRGLISGAAHGALPCPHRQLFNAFAPPICQLMRRTQMVSLLLQPGQAFLLL